MPTRLTSPSNNSSERMGAVLLAKRNPSMMSANGDSDFERRGQLTRISSKPDDDRDVAGAVCEETPAFADFRDQDARDGRADNTSAVKHRRVQSDRIHQIFFADHVDEEGLAARNIEGVDHTEKCGENKNGPDTSFLNPAAQRQDARMKASNIDAIWVAITICGD